MSAASEGRLAAVGECGRMVEMERAHWPAAEHGDTGIGIAAAVSGVTGLNPGIYLYQPDQRDFAAAAGGPVLVAELRSTYALAPALLLVYGNLDTARDSRPAQGYQRLLVRTGALGYASLLAALSTGLRGCLYGASTSIVTTATDRTGRCRRTRPPGPSINPPHKGPGP